MKAKNLKESKMKVGDKIRFEYGFYYGGTIVEINDLYCKVQLKNGDIVPSTLTNVKLDTGSRFNANSFNPSKKNDKISSDGLRLWEESVVLGRV
jgi:hypothetical protein